MAIAQSLTVSGAAGLTFTNNPNAADFTIPEGGLALPDFDMRLTYAPDTDDVPGSTLLAWSLGLGSMPFSVDVKGTDLTDLQANRRAVEAAFSQAGETVTLAFGTGSETYPFMPTWPKWGAIKSGDLKLRIITATLTIPVNPLVVG